MARHVHAFGDDALGTDDAVDLAARLGRGEVSPAELVEAAIARTERVNPALNGLAYEAFDRARRRAAGYRPRSFFAGVPTFVKDNVDVAGWPTAHGADAWDPLPPAVDGAFARAYFATGLIPLGKTQLSEFGFSAAAEHPRLGPVRNPWDTDYIAGASSSGSGAFVAAGVVPIAHANDGGGSIRIPAAVNGLVGLKPSRGRLPLDAMVRHMPVRVVANGVLTRSVRDTAAFYREAERVWRNPKLPAIGDVTGPDGRRLRIALITNSVERAADPVVADAVAATGRLLGGLGHRVEHVDRPPIPRSFVDDFVLYWGLLAMAMVRGGPRTFGPTFDVTKLDNLTRGLDRHARRNLHRLPVAIARLATTRRHTARLFADYDVVVTPTLAEPTPRVGHLDPTAEYAQIIDRLVDWVAFTPLHNVTGEPALSLPLARTADGMPIGVMFSGPLGHESRLLALGYELEQAQGWPRLDQAAQP
ncbi:amidase [Mycobacterium sp. MYCO198283]|uniref:amidase n=1 Tax=Mycobacterium sp. MYCO198283 TaxID=2883505 RepID=UPI001E2DCF95|nr:amidase [Mycobacterium sp. MYCO198283]MCG5433754.1 amidase [Mycobacterium sp. MYCO198283]